MCCKNVSFRSSVKPKFLYVLLLVVFDCLVVPYLAGFGVKSKVVVLSVFILRLLIVTLHRFCENMVESVVWLYDVWCTTL